MYKALICDVDGTLIPNRQDGMPSTEVIEAVKKASKKIFVGIATARSYWQVVHILDVLNLTAPCIITGGAQIIDPKTRKTFVERNIQDKEIKQIATIAEKMHIGLTVANREGEFIYDENKIPQKPLDIYSSSVTLDVADTFIKNISHISTVSAHKASAWDDNTKVCVTVSHPKSSKQDAVLEVAHMLHISTEEIIGVGEGYNDFPLLMAVGLKIAMGNAIPDVKAIADYIAPTVEENGVANVIEKFILEKK